MAASSSQPAKLSEDMLRVIRGEVGPEEKKGAYNQSLHKWVLCARNIAVTLPLRTNINQS